MNWNGATTVDVPLENAGSIADAMKRAVATVCTPADPTLSYVMLSSVTVAGRSKPPHPMLSDTANPGTHWSVQNRSFGEPVARLVRVKPRSPSR